MLSFLPGRYKKDRQMEEFIASCRSNQANNYKDAAKEAFQMFRRRFTELRDDGLLDEKQLRHYGDIYNELTRQMKNYGHTIHGK